MATTTATAPTKRLTELVTRRHKLLERIERETNKVVRKSLHRELRTVSREAQRLTGDISGMISDAELRSAIQAGVVKRG